MSSGSRAVFFVAAACFGAAAGMIAYRFGVLPILWSSSVSWVFPGLAMGLGFGAQAMLKNQTATRPPLPLLIITGVLAMGAAMGAAFLVLPPLGHAKLTTKQLPGFTVDLPAGKVSQELLDYGLGKYMLKDVAGTNSILSVEWEGGETTREDLELAATAVGPMIGVAGTQKPTQLPGPSGVAVDSVVIDSDKGVFRMTFVPCGKRHLQVVSLGQTGIDRIHRRVVTSIVCRPDKAQETMEPGLVPLAIELPSWFAIERLPNQVTLTDGTSALLLKAIPGNSATAADIQKLVPAMFTAMGGALETTHQQGDRIEMSGTIEGDHVDGWMRMVRCPSHSIMLLAIANDKAGADAVVTLAQSARCLREDEAPPVWPEASAVEPPAATD